MIGGAMEVLWNDSGILDEHAASLGFVPSTEARVPGSQGDSASSPQETQGDCLKGARLDAAIENAMERDLFIDEISG